MYLNLMHGWLIISSFNVGPVTCCHGNDSHLGSPCITNLDLDFLVIEMCVHFIYSLFLPSLPSYTLSPSISFIEDHQDPTLFHRHQHPSNMKYLKAPRWNRIYGSDILKKNTTSPFRRYTQSTTSKCRY